MLGSALFNVLNEVNNWKVYGTVRSKDFKNFFSNKIKKNLITNYDILNYNKLVKVFNLIKI